MEQQNQDTTTRNKQQDVLIPLVIVLLSWLFFMPGLGNVHLFDWDEINFAECAREMLVTGDYFMVQIDYRPFWEKPPLFIWFQAAAMNIFGVNEFAARFPNALLSGFTFVLLYRWGKKILSPSFGMWWAVAYFGSLLPHFYFKSGIIDPWFNVWMFSTVMCLLWAREYKQQGYALLAGVFCGLAILTKGPVGALLPGLSWIVFTVVDRKRTLWKEEIIRIGFVLLAALAVAGLWFGFYAYFYGTWFLEEFTKYQIRLLTTGDAGHSGPFHYHVWVLLLGCFPATAYWWYGIQQSKETTAEQAKVQSARLLMLCVGGVTLVIFSIVKTKILHYSSFAYFPITMLAALGIESLLQQQNKSRGGIIRWFTLVVGTLFSLLLIALPLIGMNAKALIPSIKDRFVQGNLSANAIWHGYELLPGIVLLLTTIAVAIFWKKSPRKMTFVHFMGTGIAASMFLLMAAKPLEEIIQGGAVKFYQQAAKEQAFVRSMGFKSYGQYFYGATTPERSGSYYNVPADEWGDTLVFGKISRPAYLITKITDHHGLDTLPHVEKIDEYGGFVLYRRNPESFPQE